MNEERKRIADLNLVHQARVAQRRTEAGPHACHQDCVHLSEFDVQIIQAVAQGKQTKEIALALERSPWTIRNHLIRLYARLHVHNRTELAIVAYQTGLLQRVGDA